MSSGRVAKEQECDQANLLAQKKGVWGRRQLMDGEMSPPRAGRCFDKRKE